MNTITQFTPRQRNILSALAQGNDYPYKREDDLVRELQELKEQGLIRERLASSIGHLPPTGNLRLHIVLTPQGKVDLHRYAQPYHLWMMRRRHIRQHFIEQLSDDIGLDMVLIRGGAFLMGSPDDEEGREENEGPQHEVTVPIFFMGRYPVTQAQWRYVANFPPIDPDIEFPSDPSKFKGKEDSDMRPVEQVSWYQAKEFCDRLSKYTDRTYRLPSEAEWEYACRAGTTTPFHYGETISTDVANYWGEFTYGKGQEGEFPKETTAVDSFKTGNAWGLNDMHGNVLEWCQDHWHKNYEGAPTDGSAWLTDNPESDRILRGGSWSHDPGNCRSAYRDRSSPDGQFDLIGFRVVLAPR